MKNRARIFFPPPDAGYGIKNTVRGIMDKGIDLLNRLRFLPVLLILFSGFTAFSPGVDDTAKLVASAIQSGNAAELSKYFNTMIDLTLPGHDDSYSKDQAGQIMKEFFTKFPVKSFKLTKQGSSSDGSQYSIGTLETGSGIFRVYFLIKAINGQNLIQQLQVQENS